MATTESSGTVTISRLGTTVIGIGILASLGSMFVALGLTDVLAIAGGYRPAHTLAFGYGQAFVVTVTGWTLLAVAAVQTVRAARSDAS